MKSYLTKITLAAYLGVSACGAFAGSMGQQAPENPFHGLYIGALGGVNSLSGNVSQIAAFQLMAQGTSVANIWLTPNPTAYDQNALGGILAGYDFLLSPIMLLGIEARANFFNGTIVNQTSLSGSSGGPNAPISLVSTSTAQIKQDIDLLVKPGLLLWDRSRSLYLVGGTMTNRLKNNNYVRYTQMIDAGEGVISLSGSNSFSSSKWQWGGIFGVGAQHDLINGVTLRLEYNHLIYQRAASITANTQVTPNPDIGGIFMGNLPTSSRANLRGDRVTLGLTYHFS